MQFATVEAAIEAIRNGEMLIVADDEDRENEGDLICAAELVTPEIVNFMAKQASGLICLALTPERIDQLELPLMGENNIDALRTAYTVTIDAAPQFGDDHGHQRAGPRHDDPRRGRPVERPERPPLRRARAAAARARGWRAAARRPHRGGGRSRAAGRPRTRRASSARSSATTTVLPRKRPQLEEFAAEHGLTFVTVAQLVAHRLQTERLVHRVAEARLPTEFGEWRIIGYRNDVDDHEHVALVHGDVDQGESVLVRMHSKCLTGDVFHSLRCDCGWQLHTAMAHDRQGGARRGRVSRPGRARHRAAQQAQGVRAAGPRRGHGGGQRACSASRRTSATTASARRSCSTSACKSIRPITNNPKKLVGLEGYGLHVGERVPIHAPDTAENASYLDTKRAKLGHLQAI